MSAAVDHAAVVRRRPERGERAAQAVAIVAMTAATALLAIAWLFAFMSKRANPLASTEGPDLIVPLGITAVGAIVVARRHRNPVGWLFLVSGVLDALRSAASAYGEHGLLFPGTLPAVPWAAWLANWLLIAIFPAGTLLFILLLFPGGRLLGPRWRLLGGAAVVLTAFTLVVNIFDPTNNALSSDVPTFVNPVGIAGFPVTGNGIGWVWPLGMAMLLAAAVSAFLRYRRADGEERQQLRWFAFAVVGTALPLLVMVLLGLVLPQAFDNLLFNLVIIAGIGVAIPVACGVAILKYRLYGIDVVINRALVYGTLAVLITGVYVGIAVGIGELVGSGGKPNLELSILATAIVAIGFQPARERLQRVANRLVYGRRANPYQVLSEFSSHVAGSYAADEVLPRMAHVLQEGTGAESATVWLRSADGLHAAASWPDHEGPRPSMPMPDGSLPALPGATRAVTVEHQGELLGALSVTKRRGESLTPVEEKLLGDLAHQAGLVLKNVRLTADLRRRLEELRVSRQRLVSAQDAERRRLERNLHDGAQQSLVAVKVKLGLAEMLTARDPEKARQTIAELKSDTDEALETLRDLARGIYPPLLAEKGLATALESQARKATLPVTVHAHGIARYPQEVEASVYFCVLEALQNVQRYANATCAVVRLHEDDGALRIEVEDDGRGFDAHTVRKGAGFTNMQDRLDALDGALLVESTAGHGTRVSGRISLRHAAVAAEP